ncbi:MAG: hypothetical protein CL916_10160 [Deltaproteobacteria bacterium]|nr:hypothetical protein [Deltaproteobacteria bacterium]
MYLFLSTFAFASPPQNQTAPIINGVEATSADFPETGAMLMTGDIELFGSQSIRTLVCSSTLIAPDVVLIAAHCLDDFAFTFGLGEIENKEVYWTRQANLTSWSNPDHNNPLPDDAIRASDFVIHENFDLTTLQMGLAENFDIALIFLEEPVFDVDHAFLPSAEEGANIAVGDEAIVVGWGQQIATDQFESPPAGSYAIKQQGVSSISEIAAYEFQVGLLESDVRKCHGDSGGPTFWDSGDGYRVIGVTSHAYDESDCNETGGVDTRSDYFLDWIENEMSSRCEAETRSWCDTPGIVTPDFYAEEEEIKSSCAHLSSHDISLWLVGLLPLLYVSRKKKSVYRS